MLGLLKGKRGISGTQSMDGYGELGKWLDAELEQLRKDYGARPRSAERSNPMAPTNEAQPRHTQHRNIDEFTDDGPGEKASWAGSE